MADKANTEDTIPSETATGSRSRPETPAGRRRHGAARGGEFARMMERLRQARGYFMRRYEEVRVSHGPEATGAALSEIEELLEMRAGVVGAIEELKKHE